MAVPLFLCSNDRLGRLVEQALGLVPTDAAVGDRYPVAKLAAGDAPDCRPSSRLLSSKSPSETAIASASLLEHRATDRRLAPVILGRIVVGAIDEDRPCEAGPLASAFAAPPRRAPRSSSGPRLRRAGRCGRPGLPRVRTTAGRPSMPRPTNVCGRPAGLDAR